VANVYAAIADLPGWSAWVNGVAAPVEVLGGDAFLFTRTVEGETRRHRVVVTARGPVHTLFSEVDNSYRLRFRTWPHQQGTNIEVVAEPLGKVTWWRRVKWHRTVTRHSAKLEELLTQLALHVEQRGS